MYTKILVPLDGSWLSEGILPYACFIAKVLNVPVELLQVIDRQTVSAIADPQVGRYFDPVEADMKRKSFRYLERVAGSFLDPLVVRGSVKVGNPAEVIVDRAASQRSTLIAMSTHGRSGLQRWLLGSVAEKILSVTTNPLLLVRATDTSAISTEIVLKKLLVPLDGSPFAEQVLPQVTDLAKKLALEVILLQVYDTLARGYLPYGMDQMTEKIRNEIKTYLEEKVHQLKGEGVPKVSYRSLEGNAAGEIIDIAHATPDNLVAMCTHGRSGVSRWVLGSVTDRVVRHSGDPVLIIRSSGKR